MKIDMSETSVAQLYEIFKKKTLKTKFEIIR